MAADQDHVLALHALVYRFMQAFDEKDWTLMRNCLADRVFCDYSSLRGTPPGEVSPRPRPLGCQGTENGPISHVNAIKDGVRTGSTVHACSASHGARSWSELRI